MDIIIVFGNSRKDIMIQRLDKAIAEFKSSPATFYNIHTGTYDTIKLLLLTGAGYTNGVPTSEFMRDYAVIRGIDKKFIYLEPKAKNTLENCQFVKKILDETFTLTYCIKPRLILCTSTFHMRRVMLISKFILSDYPLRYIHTNDMITEEENKRENILIIQAVNLLTKDI